MEWTLKANAFIDGGMAISGAYGTWDSYPTRIRPMDVNGDGLTDLVIGPEGAGRWFVLRSTGTSFVDDGPWISGAYGNWDSFPDRIRVMDVNGDGRQDIVIGPDGYGKWYVLRSTGTSFVNDGAWISGAYGNWDSYPNRIRVMDVNGDGMQDIVIGPEGAGNWFVLRSTGTSFVNDGAWITGAYGNWDTSADRIRVMDVNGDGMQDIVIGPDGAGNWFVLRSTGTAFVNDGAWATGANAFWRDYTNRIRAMDVNGDGLHDVVTSDGYSKTTSNTYQNDTSNWFLGRLAGSQVQSVAP